MFYIHTLRTSWIYLSKLFIWVSELLFPYFRTFSFQFLNFLHSSKKTSLILFQNIFYELLLSRFQYFIFTPFEHLEYIFQNFLYESQNFFFRILELFLSNSWISCILPSKFLESSFRIYFMNFFYLALSVLYSYLENILNISFKTFYLSVRTSFSVF